MVADVRNNHQGVVRIDLMINNHRDLWVKVVGPHTAVLHMEDHTVDRMTHILRGKHTLHQHPTKHRAQPLSTRTWQPNPPSDQADTPQNPVGGGLNNP